MKGGHQRRKRRKTILAKVNEATNLEVATDEEHQTSIAAHVQNVADDSRTEKHEQETNILVAERHKDTCFYSDLLDISNDWTAYESLFCDYFN